MASLALAAFAFSTNVSAREVAIDRDEYVTLLANVQLLKERLANAGQQISMYKKLDSDQKRLIVLHKDRIEELEKHILSSDRLTGDFKTTMDQTELVLLEAHRNLKREKRLSRYKTYAVIIGGAIIWLAW